MFWAFFVFEIIIIIIMFWHKATPHLGPGSLYYTNVTRAYGRDLTIAVETQKYKPAYYIRKHTLHFRSENGAEVWTHSVQTRYNLFNT